MFVNPISLSELIQKIRNRQVTVTEVIQDTLHRIQQFERLGAFIHVNHSAVDTARTIDERLANNEQIGPFCGAPIAIKDLITTADQPTTFGGKHSFAHLGQTDSTVALRLRQADGILIGKTNLHEYAFGTTGINHQYGTARNPWAPDRLAGGSSSGSAVAVASGLCAGAIGTDTGGSVRIPSALTGFVGFKPTYGTVPVDGTLALASSLDHIGPMAATVQDVMLLYSVINDATTRVHRREGQNGTTVMGSHVTLGIPRNFFFDLGEDNVFQCVNRAIEVLTHHDSESIQFTATDVTIPLMDEVPTAQSILLFTEAAAVHYDHVTTDSERFGADVLARLNQAMSYRGVEYVQAREAQSRFKQSLKTLFGQVDVIATPTVPVEAPKLTDTSLRLNNSEYAVPAVLNRCTNPWNLAGCPAITIPCGFTTNGLPVGLQLVAPWGNDEALLDIAYQAEAMLADELSASSAKYKQP